MVQPDCGALVNSTRYVLHPNFIFESCIFLFCRFSEYIKALCRVQSGKFGPKISKKSGKFNPNISTEEYWYIENIGISTLHEVFMKYSWNIFENQHWIQCWFWKIFFPLLENSFWKSALKSGNTNIPYVSPLFSADFRLEFSTLNLKNCW